MNRDYVIKYLRLFRKKAVDNREKPYLGYREICNTTKTSSKTLQKYLSYLCKEEFVHVIKVGKYNKYSITTAGVEQLEMLENHINEQKEIERMLSSREPRFFISTFPTPDFIGSGTVYYEPGDSFSDSGKEYVKKQLKQLLTRLHEEYPRLEFHGLFSSVPRRRAGSDLE